MTRRLTLPKGFPYGTTKVSKRRPSTGPYGKHVGLVVKRFDKIRIRGKGRR